MKLSKADFREKLARFPLGSQDGKGFDAVCIAHFFIAAVSIPREIAHLDRLD